MSLLLDRKVDLAPFFALSPIPMCILGTNLLITDANPAAERAFGRSADELRARPIVDIIHPDDRASTVDHVSGLKPEHASVTFENRCRRADGAYESLAWTVTLANGLLYACARDIVEGAPREGSPGLGGRAADGLKSDFASLIAHELRTPLTSIKGFLELILGGETGEINPVQREFLGIVRNSADGLASLISNLLTVTRIESGNVNLVRQPIDVVELIRSAAESCRPDIDRKGQQLLLVADQPKAMVGADRDRLREVMINLVRNANQYTPIGGRVTCWSGVVDGMVRLEVRDTGIGMTADEQARVFEKFYRASNRTTQEVGGHGLGLSVVEAQVRLHGGTIEVRSEKGHGSVFSVMLPPLEG